MSRDLVHITLELSLLANSWLYSISGTLLQWLENIDLILWNVFIPNHEHTIQMAWTELNILVPLSYSKL